jgi:hypothetical protein
MEELANNIYIEQEYPGVVSSVLKLDHGLVLIDAPLRSEHRQAWQQKLVSLGGGIARVMIMLDANPDRLLGALSVDAPILAHENTVEIINDLPSSVRLGEKTSGSDSESVELPQNNRWVLPDMVYSHAINIYWDEQPVVVTHQPGGHLAGSWVRYPAEKVIFVGDSVVISQPPFLAWCDLDRWIDELTWLSSDLFRDYQIISGRDGVVSHSDVLEMIDFLTTLNSDVEELSQLENWPDEIDQWIPRVLEKFEYDPALTQQYANCLAWGMNQLLKRISTDHIETKGEINAG